MEALAALTVAAERGEGAAALAVAMAGLVAAVSQVGGEGRAAR